MRICTPFILLFFLGCGEASAPVIDAPTKSCEKQSDCPADQVCVGTVCQPISTARCVTDEDCVDGQKCLSNGNCQVAECEVASDCCGGDGACDKVCQNFECFGTECVEGQTQDCLLVCHVGQRVCEKGTWLPCNAEPVIPEEICVDNIDNDCNGLTDDGCKLCSAGDVQACTSQCGEGQQTCTPAGQWAPCDAPLDCTCDAGESTTKACGNCGEQSGTCSPDGVFVYSDLCIGEGECAATSAESQECGKCGSQVRLCNTDCGWEKWSECIDEGTCEPGETEQEGCGNCGSRIRTCTDACGWGEWSECLDGAGCQNGDVQTKTCGLCGTQTSTCNSQCQWSEFGACESQGVCTPGEVTTQDCGNCGEQTRICGDDCMWGSWTSCTGAGECAPGQIQTQTCGPDSTAGICEQGEQIRTCNAACQYGAWDSCLGAVYPAAEICGNGIDEDCTDGDKTQPDDYEPNNSCVDCAWLGSDPEILLNPTFDNPTDEWDYFCFNGIDNASIPGFGEKVKVQLTNQAIGMDADIYLWRGDDYSDAVTSCNGGTSTDIGANGNSQLVGPDDESIEWTESTLGVSDSGIFIVGVRNFEATGFGCAKAYTLFIKGLK